MKLSKKKNKSIVISTIAIIIFFIVYFISVINCIIYPDEVYGTPIVESIKDSILSLIVVLNALLINRYLALGLSIYSYIKYKTKYSKIIMIILIGLQIISIISLIIWGATVDFSIDG